MLPYIADADALAIERTETAPQTHSGSIDNRNTVLNMVVSRQARVMEQHRMQPVTGNNNCGNLTPNN